MAHGFTAGAFIRGAFIRGAFIRGDFISGAFIPGAFVPGGRIPDCISVGHSTSIADPVCRRIGRRRRDRPFMPQRGRGVAAGTGLGAGGPVWLVRPGRRFVCGGYSWVDYLVVADIDAHRESRVLQAKTVEAKVC